MNSLPVCQGLITRKIDLKNGRRQKSIIDFFVVCSRVLPFIKEMMIDESNNFITTNYTKNETSRVNAINSDHNTQFVKMGLDILPIIEQRREIYNLKNVLRQMKFKKLTESSQYFSSCFTGSDTLSVKCRKWKKYLDTHIKKSFRKIKVSGKKVKPSAADVLIDKRNKIKQAGTHNVKQIEAKIVQIILKEEVNKAQQFVTYCNITGTISLRQMWKLKKELWPKKKPSLQVAKKNHKGRLISSPKELMHLLQK